MLLPPFMLVKVGQGAVRDDPSPRSNDANDESFPYRAHEQERAEGTQ